MTADCQKGVIIQNELGFLLQYWFLVQASTVHSGDKVSREALNEIFSISRRSSCCSILHSAAAKDVKQVLRKSNSLPFFDILPLIHFGDPRQNLTQLFNTGL